MATLNRDVHFGRLLEPGLRKIFFDTYKEVPEQYPKYMNVHRSDKAVEVDLRMGGFGLWNKKGTMDSTEYDEILAPIEVYYKHETWSRGFQVEKEWVDDERYNIINKLPKNLARTARATIEQVAVSLLNEAFTAKPTNPMGEALVQDNHRRLDGGTASNYIGALQLNEANLEIALKLAAEQVDERGIKIQMTPDTLVVPRSLEFTAEKIVKSVHIPMAGGNTEAQYGPNDINPMQGRFKVVVLDYLTDDGRWFLIDSKMNPLNFFWRERLNFKGTNDFDTDVAKYKGRFRISVGWTDWRGILGANPNAA